jgi:hypothetical protein
MDRESTIALLRNLATGTRTHAASTASPTMSTGPWRAPIGLPGAFSFGGVAVEREGGDVTIVDAAKRIVGEVPTPA